METIRQARTEDLPAIGRIVREIWAAGSDALFEARYGAVACRPWQDWTEEAILQDLSAKLANVVVCEVGGRIAGWVSYDLDEARKVGTVGYNGVALEFRGRGIGGRMLAWALEEMKRHGMTHAKVFTLKNEGHAPARGMYENAGFEPLVESVLYTKPL